MIYFEEVYGRTVQGYSMVYCGACKKGQLQHVCSCPLVGCSVAKVVTAVSMCYCFCHAVVLCVVHQAAFLAGH
jgi:hypothetical protein